VIGSRDKRTALHLACSTGSTEFTQLLLWSNADIRALDESGRSALWYAQNAGSRSCAAVLMNAGLQPNYGIPELNGAGGAMQNGQLLNSHGQSESVNGSSSSSQVAIGLSHDNNLARLRRCSDVISNNTRMVQPAARNSISVTTANKITNNNTAALIQQRASDAFERLPASII